jgi:GWxTD domain-containing protein
MTRTRAMAAALVLLAAGCRLYNLERKLDPPNAEFLSKVRYIIAPGERKAFLELPASARPAFIEDFWKRRDPDPRTPENEFKDEYFKRIDQADKLFLGEGPPGWQTDRGRVLILYGAPSERTTPSMGNAYGRCQEIWYYGNFPVVFLDETCTGSYRLMTFDLTALRDINLAFMPDASLARPAAEQGAGDAPEFDFEVRLVLAVREPDRIEGAVVLEAAYDRIWFKAEGRTLFTTLEAALELRDERQDRVWDDAARTEVRIGESEFRAGKGGTFRWELPILIRDPEKIGRLGRGRDVLTLSLRNTTGNETRTKTLDFR